MKRQAVESTVIDAVGYTRVLEIRFESGRVYQYYDVPPRIFRGMMRAASKGRYFNRYVRGKFPYQEITLIERVAQAGSSPGADAARES